MEWSNSSVPSSVVVVGIAETVVAEVAVAVGMSACSVDWHASSEI
jgi:hypothetical protein